ncbi:hypothetical protein DMN91_012522 [Ooceraea biroi]|uniref:Golgi integral membrane protein n=1 Tax=Ooceraea biroi TaxID=2015173 RepID=A0A026W2L5_OOCBI|nr:Golgi integral membrane protein 4 [Ooceraea biroi]XP_026830398.1 Golgi integral membrane protein 4 [Ooceraea biroi]EZA50248.1 Golgi integral membrane protein [Ooceraea biroi]RLU15528.1 hypothetical protein DMN91_012522 [Ooceraea biroi]
MSGSRLGRGRAGRLAVYGVCGAVVILLVYLYRAATSEMARLRELHEQCAHQQEALAAQLQVIFEYKVRLEKSLAEEKSSNVAVKQELQQRASREKSLRDKDSVEALQRFNSLQQTYKLLQTEHQDLQEECKKREKQTLEETNRLETTLQDLRGRIRQSQDNKELLESLKTKYLALDTEKTNLEEKYNELMINNGNSDSIIDHLKKEIFQLKRELQSSKRSHRSTPPIPVVVSSRLAASQATLRREDSQPIPAPQQQQPQPQSMVRDAVSSRKAENTTAASPVSPSQADRVAPLPIKSLSKVKLPAGVLPIPEIIEPKIEEKRQEDVRKRDDTAARNDPPAPPQSHKLAPVNAIGSKEEKEEVVEAGNLDPPFVANPPAAGHHGEQVADRRANEGGWFRVGPGVQEVGEEVNQLGRIPGLDDGQVNGGDDQYDGGDYDKEPQQKNDIRLAEGEDEGEDEGDMLEYPHNLKQGKRE